MKNYITVYSFALFVGLMGLGACSSESDANLSSLSSGQGGSMARFTISGNHLYTVDNERLKMFDISTTQKPQYLPSKDQQLGFGVETIFVKDTLLFIGSQQGMYIYDISRPAFPQQASFTSHISSCDPVVAQGNYAYVTLNSKNVWCGRNANELQIFDISDPAAPRLVKTERSLLSPLGLGVDGNKLFVCDNGLKVYDINDPEKPRWTDDLGDIPDASGIDAYDVIPLNGTLLLIGADGLYQFNYTQEKIAFVSKITVDRGTDLQ